MLSTFNPPFYAKIYYKVTATIYKYDNITVYEEPNFYRSYSLNNLIHRLDGPAVEHDNGLKFWWFHGKFIKCNSQQEFERKIRLTNFE